MSSVRSPLGVVIDDYLALKRALGRKFFDEGYVLASLDRFLVARGPDRAWLTPESFAAWSLTLAHLSPTTRRRRMRMVWNLCLYRRRTQPDCFVPDPSSFPQKREPRRPHIFTEEELVRLLRAAGELSPRSNSPLCGPVCRLAIVLLYTAGLRRGELARLVLSDYDPVERTLLIRTSKFHKSRLVALSPDAVREMEAYLLARRRFPHGADSTLMVWSFRGLRARSGSGLGDSLRLLIRRAGIRTVSGRPPRVHDLRHTHAVHVLRRWYQAGLDVQAKLPALAASMGHVSITSTAYYLPLLDPVAEAASDRYAQHCAALFASSPSGGGDR
jgi:integrase/recombinase XerD